MVRFEPNARQRKMFATDLSRLLSSQLSLAIEAGEKLEDIVLGLENSGVGKKTDLKDAADKPAWGPSWKD